MSSQVDVQNLLNQVLAVLHGFWLLHFKHICHSLFALSFAPIMGATFNSLQYHVSRRTHKRQLFLLHRLNLRRANIPQQQLVLHVCCQSSACNSRLGTQKLLVTIRYSRARSLLLERAPPRLWSAKWCFIHICSTLSGRLANCVFTSTFCIQN